MVINVTLTDSGVLVFIVFVEDGNDDEWRTYGS